MSNKIHLGVLALLLAAGVTVLFGQEAMPTSASSVSVVPHLIKYSGTLPGDPGVVDVKFALYAAQTGGDPLWTEIQSISLDTTGKYSVILGSTTAVGVPASVFANGQARWIGVTLGSEQESARTVLVATPYSLKASDAETLGGHPASDFALKNALPATGTDITQINVGNGVTGGGTGPTVTLGLSSSYLETLGNEIYPQLGGTNKLTGTNTYTAGKLLVGTAPVLSASNLLAASPITVSSSGGNVTVGLSDSALVTLGNSVYAQLGAANTFSGSQNTFSGSTSGTLLSASNAGTNGTGVTASGYVGIHGTGSSTSPTGTGMQGSGTVGVNGTTSYSGDTSTAGVDAMGVYGLAPAAAAGYNAFGVYGASDSDGIGVYGTSAGGVGIYGFSPAFSGVAGLGLHSGVVGEANIGGGNYGWAVAGSNNGQGSTEGASFSSTSSAGVWGDLPDGVGDGSGILATSDGVTALIAVSNGTAPTMKVFNYTTDTGSTVFETYSPNVLSGASHCTIDAFGDLTCSGTVSEVVHEDGGAAKAIYGISSADNWIEDAGTGQLSSGHAKVALDTTFAGTVNTGVDYHVFLTPKGDCNGLYVANETSAGFEVHELGGGKSSTAFDYRIMAKRKGYESVRLQDLTVQENARIAEMAERAARTAAARPNVRPAIRVPRRPAGSPMVVPPLRQPSVQPVSAPHAMTTGASLESAQK